MTVSDTAPGDMSQAGDATGRDRSAAPVVRIAVLGPVTADTGAGAAPVGAPQQRRLLCLLAAAALEGRAVSAPEMLDELYDGRAGRSSRGAAATALWRLRGALGSDVLTGGASGYSLDPRRCEVDIVSFEDLVTGGHASLVGGDPSGADRQLGRALAMWASNPLADMISIPSGRAVAARLEEMRLGAIEDRAAALAMTGRRREAVGLLAGLTGSHPSREHAWALLAETHLANGHRSEARRVLDVAARGLAEQGLEPGAELEEVRRRAGTATGAGDVRADEPPGPPLPDIGRPSLGAKGPAGDPQGPGRVVGAGGRIVGRSQEARQLVAAARRSLAGGVCQLLLVEGEAGIGKTTLLEAVGSALAAEGAHVGVSFADDRMELPYAAVRPWMTEMAECIPDDDVARFLFGDPVAASGPDPAFGDPAVLRHAIAVSLGEAALRRGPTVLVLDDAHMATGPLLETLTDLLRCPPAAPLCLIAAVRDPDPSGAGRTPALRPFRRAASTRVHLGGLDLQAVKEILATSGRDAALAEWVHEVTAGNALFVTQLAQLDLGWVRASLGNRLPWMIEDAIDSRIEALPPQVASVLRVAAVVGAEIDGRILAATADEVLSLDFLAVTEAVERAIEAGLLAPVSTSERPVYSWVHSLVAERLYHTIRASQRARMHAVVGSVIERMAITATAEPALLAHHYALAWPSCPVETAVRHLRRAGERSAAELDFERAGEFFARALDLLNLDPRRAELAETIYTLLELAARAASFAGDPAKARQTYGRLDALGGAEWKLRAALGVVATYVNERIDPAALDSLEAALESSTPETSGPEAAVPAGTLVADGLALLSLYRPSAAYDLVSKLSGTPEMEASALIRVWELQPVDRQARIARRLIRHQRADPQRAWLRHVVSEIAAGRGRLTDSTDPASVPADLLPSGPARRAPSRSPEGDIELQLWRIAVASAAGEVDHALHLIAQTRTRLEGIADLASSTAYMANLAGQDNWLAFLGAEAHNLTRIRWPEPKQSVWHHAGEQISAFITARKGLTGQASATCERLVADLLDGALPEGNRLARLATLASACRASGYRRGMEVCLEHLQPHADQHIVFFVSIYWGSVSQRLGGLHLGLGNLQEARDNLERAVEEHDRVGARVLALWSRCDLAEALWRLGGPVRPQAQRLWEETAPLAIKFGGRAATLRQWPPAP